MGRSNYTVVTHIIVMVNYTDDAGVYHVAAVDLESNIVPSKYRLDAGYDVNAVYVKNEEWLKYRLCTKLKIAKREQIEIMKPFIMFHTSTRTGKLIPDSMHRFVEILDQAYE